MPSLILPAHNEASLLTGHLEILLQGLREDVQVIVACNGCSDETAAIARTFEPRVSVLDLPVPSKTAALNAADEVAQGFPRVYLDADVEVSGDSMNLVIEAMEGGAIAAEPVPRLDTTGASWLVRAYYRAWQALHGHRPGAVGSGLYGLSQEGREHFEQFPDVIADDGYVRAHFGPGEIEWVKGASSRVRTPLRLRDLIRIKTRSRLGNLQLQREEPALWQRKAKTGESLGTKLSRVSPLVWPCFLVYLPVQLRTRQRAGQQALDLESYRWERDESSRQG